MMAVREPFSDIYLTATAPQHLTRQLNIVTSIVATQLSHFLSQAAIDKLSQSDYRLHPLETIGSRKLPEIKGFRAYFPLTLDINTTVSTCVGFTIREVIIYVVLPI